MKTPDQSHRCFAVLSPMLDGRPWTRAEIEKAIGWPRSKNMFSQYMRRLLRKGLVRELDDLAAYAITDTGKREWAEAIDFYQHLAGFADRTRLSASRKRAHPLESISRRLRHHDDHELIPERRPTPDEVEQIIVQDPSLELIVRAMLEAKLPSLDDLLLLEVADVDLGAGTFYARSLRTACDGSAALLACFSRAIGRRQAGRVFVGPRGASIGRTGLCRRFARARARAGLEPCVKISGRHKAARATDSSREGATR